MKINLGRASVVMERGERNQGVRVEERRVLGGMMCVIVENVYEDKMKECECRCGEK